MALIAGAGHFVLYVAVLSLWFDLARSQSTLSSQCDAFLDGFRSLVKSAKLSLARKNALDELLNPSPHRCGKKKIAQAFAVAFRECYDSEGPEYFRRIEASMEDGDLLHRSTVRAKIDGKECTMGNHMDRDFGEAFDPNEWWDTNCSVLPGRNDNHYKLVHKSTTALSSFPLDSSFGSASPQASSSSFSSYSKCCEFTPGSWTYLRLPVIHEPAIRLRIPYHRKDSLEGQRANSIDDKSSMEQEASYFSLELEQDGYLRPFEVSGILWPTGYLLSLCLGNPDGCPIPELGVLVDHYEQETDSSRRSFPLAIELGAGVGASSIALAKSLRQRGILPILETFPPWVVATDVAPHALALTIANAKHNDAAKVDVRWMDHFNQSSIRDVRREFFPTEGNHLSPKAKESLRKRHDGFSLVFGSSLQGLFAGTDQPDSHLWKALDELMDSQDPNALAILVHNRADPIQQPPISYRIVRKVSGSEEFFGNMRTRTGEASDFEICVVQRVVPVTSRSTTVSSTSSKAGSSATEQMASHPTAAIEL